MQYAVLMYENAAAFAARTNEEQEAYWGAWSAYIGALNEAGVIVLGQGLQPPTVATTIRLSEGKRHVQDGPYADTKEQLGGFFVLELPSLDAAMQWAARCPAAATGAVEIRPILVMPGK